MLDGCGERFAHRSGGSWKPAQRYGEQEYRHYSLTRTAARLPKQRNASPEVVPASAPLHRREDTQRYADEGREEPSGKAKLERGWYPLSD